MGEHGSPSGLEGSEPAASGEVGARDGETQGRDAAAGDSDPGSRHSSGTTVENGEIKRLSPSSIAKYDATQYGGCPRRWWYRYVARKPEPQSAAASKGVELHSNIERYLLGKEDTLRGTARVAQSLCDELKRERIAVEQPLGDGLKADGIPLSGYIDVVRWERDTILDWKRTSKSVAELPAGSQMLVTVPMPAYGQWYLNASGASRVRLEHAYIKQGWREPKVRGAECSRDQVVDRWAEIEGVVRRMRADARATDPEDVPGNTESCDAYGGCPHRSYCSAAPSRGRTMSTLYEELKRRKKSKTDVLPPDAPASGEAAPAAEPVPAEELAKLPEDAQKIVRDYEGEAGFVQYSGTYTKATVVRVVKLGNFNMIHVGLEMALTDVKDPKAALRDMARELDDFAEEYRQEKKA